MLSKLILDVSNLASAKRAKASQWYFKTGPGEYGYGDVFIGLSVPQMRAVAKKYKDLELQDIAKLLNSKFHEHRFIGLEILVMQFESASSQSQKKKIFEFYLSNTKGINNWDLVDTSAPYIVGAYLQDRSKNILYRLAKSKNIWERRMAVLATAKFIARSEFTEIFRIAEMLLGDRHDLIHKAVGWMLRETGKKDLNAEIGFLDKHYRRMPRTMLRYAIEKFPDRKRKYYLKKLISKK